MRRSLETSHLLKVRSEHIVPKRIVEIEEAIKRKNFAQFAKLTIMVGKDASSAFRFYDYSSRIPTICMQHA